MSTDYQSEQTFNPREHLMQIKNKSGSSDYLPVQWRLVWFRSLCPEGTIDTEEVEVDLDREVEEEAYVWNNETRRSEKTVKRARGYARFRAVVTDGRGGRATGTKSETAASFPDFIEKSETGSIGRALAALGYGTQFAPELDEQPRIVDAPVDRNNADNTRRPLASIRPSVHAQTSTQEQSQEASDILPAIQRMIDIARSRVEKLVPAKSWEAIKAEALGEAVLDSKIVIGDFTRINGLITKYEREHAA